MGQEISEESASLLTQCDRNTAVKSKKIGRAFFRLYEGFRSSGLSKLDSAFNAFYICQTNKFCSKTVNVNDAGDGFIAPPSGWFKGKGEKEERVIRAAKTRTLRLLSILAKALSPFSKSVSSMKATHGFFSDSSILTLKNLVNSAKRARLAILASLCAFVLVASVIADSDKQAVVEVSVNGEPIGVVASVKTVDSALDKLNSSVSAVINESFYFPHDISYEIKKAVSPKCMDIDGVYTALSEYTQSYTVEAYGLYIDGELIAALESKDDIMYVLDTLKSEHMQLTGENEDIANKIDIKYQEYSPEVLTQRDVLMSLFSVPDEQEDQTVQERALLANPVTPSVVTLEGLTPEFAALLETNVAHNSSNAVKLDFAVYYEETVRESVAYETKYVQDDMYYQGQEFVSVTGRNGTADNTYKVEYIDGTETGRVLLEQSIVKEPRACVIKVGTRVLPESLSDEVTGGRYMINPVPQGTVSSQFGWRILRGRSDFHEALDILAPKGTSIFACASGEVIYAGYSNSWGNYIKIRHADGLVTLYAHCSQLLVSTGDTVSQGEEIALVGSTGDSTGYHLHLEVRKNDIRVDPEDYIYSMK